MNAELSCERVLDILVGHGLLGTDDAKSARVREPVQRARVLREQIGAGRVAGRAGTHYRVTAPEVLASMALAQPDGTPLTEDAIMQAIASAEGLEWRRLEPLELDVQLVTSVISKPFARRHLCIAIGEADGRLVVAMAEPRDLLVQEELRRVTGRELTRVVASKTDILRIISEFYGFRHTIRAAERQFRRSDEGISNLEQLFRIKSDAELEATDQHIVAAVDYLFRHAYDQRASDIHVEPKREQAIVRYRIDGVLHTVHRLPKPIVPAVTSRIKMMARLDIAEKRRPQDGRIKTLRDGEEVELRVSAVPTAFGEKIVARIFDPDVVLQDIGELGFFEDQGRAWHNFASRPHGMVLLTGPTGSGKTTTLYSTLKVLAGPEVNITTVEDPIEMVTDAFNQIAVNPKKDVTFASALRAVLRQDPDIVMVGEIRDLETARLAVQAALTGHLVLSTLHTNDAAGAFTRLIDLGIEPFLVASTVVGVAAQRLVRRVCDRCAVETHLGEAQVRLLGIEVPPDGDPLPVRDGEGCVDCRGTGYRGRSGVYEVLPVSASVRHAVRTTADTDHIKSIARREGMLTLHEAAVRKLALGVTTFDEVIRVTRQDD